MLLKIFLSFLYFMIEYDKLQYIITLVLIRNLAPSTSFVEITVTFDPFINPDSLNVKS